MAHTHVALALLVPALAVAQVTPAAGAPAAAAPAPEAAPAQGAGAAPASASAPSTAAPGTTPVATPTAPAKEDHGSWVVLKGGWFGTSEDYQGESFSGSGEWELA